MKYAPKVAEAEQKGGSPGSRKYHFAIRFRALVELTKPNITLLVVLTASLGYCQAARGRINIFGLIFLVLGVGLLSSGIGTLNQYIERDVDALMYRTRKRPLPSNRVKSRLALVSGFILSFISIVILAAKFNLLTAAIGLFTFVSYLFLYTPLKTRTTLSTIIGAIPGAMPPVVGWAAARGEIGFEACVLFSIMFLWQFPHFLAIAWIHQEDYARAGVKMLPVVEPDGLSTSFQIVNYSLLLVPVSIFPSILGMSGYVYLIGAIILGTAFLCFALKSAIVRSEARFRRLQQASVLYLPLLFLLMVFDR